MKIFFLFGLLFIIIVSSCSVTRRNNKEELPNANAASAPEANKAKVFIKPISVNRNDFVAAAKKLLGVPYKYGSSIPENGLDCSGFVYYVFNQFNIKAPRTTVAFTYEGKEVTLNKARVGDIILLQVVIMHQELQATWALSPIQINPSCLFIVQAVNQWVLF